MSHLNGMFNKIGDCVKLELVNIVLGVVASLEDQSVPPLHIGNLLRLTPWSQACQLSGRGNARFTCNRGDVGLQISSKNVNVLPELQNT